MYKEIALKVLQQPEIMTIVKERIFAFSSTEN